jgi:RHS repeat-associated protein
MTEALASGVQLASYTYNGKGERVKKAGPATAAIAGETELFSDDFSAPDGTVIDDQPGGAWRGKRPVEDTSAIIEAGTANVLPGQVIRTIETFDDTGDTTLVVRATISQGTLILKKPGLPHGVKVRFNGKRRVAITAGVFNDDTRRTKAAIQLPDLSDFVNIELRLHAGTARVVVTDDKGASQDSGTINNAVFTAGDTYRLKLRAIRVLGVPVPGRFDQTQVTRDFDLDSNSVTHFVYDQGSKLIGEYDAAGVALAEYVYLLNQPLAMTQDNEIHYYHIDHLGTPLTLTNNNQTLAWGANYTPFGDASIFENAVRNPLRFPGQNFDEETGLHYNYFRDYDAGLGRYLESDPLGLAGGLNVYAYANLNPLNTIDPLGLRSNPLQPLLDRLGSMLGRGASDKIVGRTRAQECENEFCNKRIFAPTIDMVSEVCLKLSSGGDFGSGKFGECLSGCLERTKTKEYQKRCVDGQSCFPEKPRSGNV